ncbi:MAG: HmuY family protein [Bacteroidetes bacterium]|nr:HmuY family protein [Bacteroidota bacterium]
MIRSGRFIVIIAVSLVLHSCFKKDEAVPVHPRGPVKTDTIALTDNYKFQVYFDLATGTAVSTNLRTESDLGFECSSSGWKIILNTGDFMKVADMGVIPFGEPHDTTGMKMSFDKSDGNPDSLAFGRWFTLAGGDTLSLNHVYAISRGIDPNGNPLGLYQVIFDSLKMGTYYFRFAKLNGQDVRSAIITKDPSMNYIWYSFNSGGSVKNLEPPKDSFDLLFTQYTTLLYTDEGEAYPYLVTGVLLNRNLVRAAKDSIHDFSAMDLETANSIQLSPALDGIGYDWKRFDFNSASYTVLTDRFYLVRDKSGYLYKLRFIGFYNGAGEKGYPVIEYQAL